MLCTYKNTHILYLYRYKSIEEYSGVSVIRVCKFLFLFLNLFIFGCVGSSLLRAAFSSYGERGLLFVAACGLLIAVASLVVEHRL